MLRIIDHLKNKKVKQAWATVPLTIQTERLAEKELIGDLNHD